MRACGRVLLLLVLGLAACEATGRGAPGEGIAHSADDLYTTELIPRFELGLSPEARDQLARAPKKWVHATFTYAGQVFPDVAVRLKGHRSAEGLEHKPSFKVRFDKYVPGRRFLGQSELVLNNLVEDPTLVREALGYELHRALGVAAPRTGYAQLSVDGVPYGIYLDVEAVDEHLLERAYGDGSGVLYEGEYGCDLYAGDAAGFELDGGDDAEHAQLAALAELAESAPEQLLAVDGPIDRERVLAYLAVSTVIGDFDGYRHSHNYRIYRDPGDGRWSLLPWGLDRSFKKRMALTDYGGVLARRCFGDASCRLDYLRTVEQVLGRFEAMVASGLPERLITIADAAARGDRRKPYNAARTRAARADLRRFLRERAGQLRAQLGRCRDGLDDACDGGIGAPPTCEAVDAAGASLRLCAAPRTWSEAQSFCRGLGLELAWLDDAAQAQALGGLLAKRGGKDRWWMGLSDAAEEGVFRWSQGAPPAHDVVRWSKGQPDNDACGEDCAAVKAGGKWSDAHCELRQPFICR